MTLGEKIRFVRKLSGLTMKEVAETSGISDVTIANYEHNVTEPSFFNMCCLADILKVPLDYFTGKKELTEKEKEEIFKRRWEKQWQDMS